MTITYTELAPHLFDNDRKTSRASEHGVILASISRCSDARRLRQWIYNADQRHVSIVRNAAYRQLAHSVEDKSADALQNAALKVLRIYQTRLCVSRCYSVKLSKYVQILNKQGAVSFLTEMAGRKKFLVISEQLAERDLSDLTVEATIAAFAKHFDRETVLLARKRLKRFRALSNA